MSATALASAPVAPAPRAAAAPFVLSDRDRAHLLAVARHCADDAERRGDLIAGLWRQQAALWATDTDTAAAHLYDAGWRELLRVRVDPKTAEIFARRCAAADSREHDERRRLAGRIRRALKERGL